MKNKGLVFMAHPPIVVPEVGKGREKEINETLAGFREAAKKIKEWKPDVLVIITPHGNSFRDALSVISTDKVTGSLSDFGYHKNVSKKTNTDIVEPLQKMWSDEKIPYIFLDNASARDYRLSLELDHGALVPMYFIDEVYDDYEIVHVTPGFLSPKQLYRAGMIMGEALEKQDKTYAVVASADLSHALKDSGPYSYHEDGKTFDRLILECFQNSEPEKIFSIPSKIRDNAQQCGFNSYAFALGFYDDLELDVSVLSYQETFGVGYLNGYASIKGNCLNSKLEVIRNLSEKKNKTKRENENIYVRLARETIEGYVTNNRTLSWLEFKKNVDEKIASNLENKQAGAFVTIHKNGQLRGCIGTTESTKENLAHEIINNAISSSTRDPRFPPIRVSELQDLEISVDVLGPVEAINSKHELEITKYGVVVESGHKKGLLLPNLDGVDSVDEQVSIAKEKAGIRQGEKFKLFRFKVNRY